MCLVDVLDPFVVGSEVVGTKTDHLNATGVEFILQLCECTELGRADWCEVSRVTRTGCQILACVNLLCWSLPEENSPLVIEELVEVNVSMCCLCLEVGGWRTISFW